MASLGKKIGIGCLSSLGLLVVGLLIAYLILNESKPEGITGPEADRAAEQMLKAIDKPAWDSLNYISWSFMDRQHYAWDKRNEIATISWKDIDVVFDLKAMAGKAMNNNKELDGDLKDQVLGEAWAHWCNDSFWLYAPYKIFDPGVSRTLVKMEDGKTGIMATYESGGVTPGDSYLWILNDNYEPEAWKMWVKIIPLGGLYNSWEDWFALPHGGKIAQSHKSKLMNIKISNIKAGQTLADIELDQNPFTL